MSNLLNELLESGMGFEISRMSHKRLRDTVYLCVRDITNEAYEVEKCLIEDIDAQMRRLLQEAMQANKKWDKWIKKEMT